VALLDGSRLAEEDVLAKLAQRHWYAEAGHLPSGAGTEQHSSVQSGKQNVRTRTQLPKETQELNQITVETVTQNTSAHFDFIAALDLSLAVKRSSASRFCA
jgi:hypothetical protein